jgi:hypothetical protein
VYEVEIQGLKGTAKAWIIIPDNGARVSGNAVTVKADATDNTRSVKFQYRKNNLVQDLIMPVDGRVKVTLTKASASLISDVYISIPVEQLLISNNLINVGVKVEDEYAAGTKLNFFIRTNGTPWVLGIYDHYADSKFCKITRNALLKWTLSFEDLPESRADWDYNDVIISVEIIPSKPVSDDGSSWVDIALDAKKPYSVYWNTSVLTNGAYDLRAVAYDNNNLPDPDPATITVYVDDKNAYIIESGNTDINQNNTHSIQTMVLQGQDTQIITADGTGAFVPRGTFAIATFITIKSLLPYNISVPVGESVFKPIGVYRQYEIGNAGSGIFSAGRTGGAVFSGGITITLPYPDENLDGVVDGTNIGKNDLVVMYLDEANKEWLEASPAGSVLSANSAYSAVDRRVNGRISVRVRHFTIFGLFYIENKTDLDSVIVYPNPFKTRLGDTSMTFDGLTDNAGVKIYTVAGRLVKELDSEKGGAISWNVAEDNIESGIYFYVVTNSKGDRKTGKIAVIR